LEHRLADLNSTVDARKAYQKAWREANRENLRAYARNYRKENIEALKKLDAECYLRNRDKVRTRSKEWAIKNPEARRRIESDWASRNPGKSQTFKRTWMAKNPWYRVVMARLRRLKIRQAFVSWANMAAVSAIYAEARAQRQAGKSVHVDHSIPLTHADVCGLHNEFNLVIMAASANRAKSNKFTTDWS
jgi:hypothetical protein